MKSACSRWRQGVGNGDSEVELEGWADIPPWHDRSWSCSKSLSAVVFFCCDQGYGEQSALTTQESAWTRANGSPGGLSQSMKNKVSSAGKYQEVEEAAHAVMYEVIVNLQRMYQHMHRPISRSILTLFSQQIKLVHETQHESLMVCLKSVELSRFIE